MHPSRRGVSFQSATRAWSAVRQCTARARSRHGDCDHLVRGGSLGGVALQEARDEVLGGLADAEPRRAGQVHRRPQDHLEPNTAHTSADGRMTAPTTGSWCSVARSARMGGNTVVSASAAHLEDGLLCLPPEGRQPAQQNVQDHAQAPHVCKHNKPEVGVNMQPISLWSGCNALCRCRFSSEHGQP